MFSARLGFMRPDSVPDTGGLEPEVVSWRDRVQALEGVTLETDAILVLNDLVVGLKDQGAWDKIISENASLAASSVLRGGYHLYQGVGAGLGNVVMGLVFGRFFQVTSRVWPLVVAHAVMDIVAFVGYALLHDHLSWVG